MLDQVVGDPLASVVVFYSLVFAGAELARNAVDVASPSFLKVYLYEIIGTMTMCLCVFENGFMLSYGYMTFFVTVAIVLHIGARLNRGAQVSPLGNLESLYYGGINVGHFLGVLFSQLIAAIGAFLLIGHIWYNSSNYLKHHRGKVEELYKCHLHYKVSFTLVILFEFIGCALIRVLMPILSSKLPEKTRIYVIPAFFSFMITSSIYFLGAAGLNPVVASCRMMSCQGLDTQWFILLYWFISTAGYIFGATVSRAYYPSFYKAKAKKASEPAKSRPAPKGVKEEAKRIQNKNKKKDE